MRSIVFFFRAWILRGNSLILRAGSGDQRSAAAQLLGGAFLRER